MTEQTAALPWRPIADLPPDFESPGGGELRSLTAIWEEQRAELEQNRAVQEFNARLLRRWAIETGLIERVYTLDRGTTQLLVERGLSASLIPHYATDKDPELVVRIIQDQHYVVEGLFDFVANRRELGTSYIKELHAALTAHQPTTEAVDQFGRLIAVPLLRGEYKRQPNNPRRADGTFHEYCPPEHVAAEMDRLVALHRAQQEQGISPEVRAAWLHHRFTQIHPFQDGNGRVARALATLVFLQAGWLPLVITDLERGEYIAALEQADAGDFEDLVALFVRIAQETLSELLIVPTQNAPSRELTGRI